MTEATLRTIDQAEEISGKTPADPDPDDEIVNDSLGTVDVADTADTDPQDDPASKPGNAEADKPQGKAAAAQCA